jgi:hypothetical protein
MAQEASPTTESSTPAFGCDCIGQLNAALLKQGSNTLIGDAVLFDMKNGGTRTVVEIATYKRDPKKREKARSMVPEFCPFCGTRYQPDDASRPPADATGGAR